MAEKKRKDERFRSQMGYRMGACSSGSCRKQEKTELGYLTIAISNQT